MKYDANLELAGIAAPGDSGGANLVTANERLLLVGINDQVRLSGTSTATGFEYFGYRGPNGTDQTVFEWFDETIANDISAEGESEGTEEPQLHAADVNGDWIISLDELLRLIQFYNMGGYHCPGVDEISEDGFIPGVDTGKQACVAHDSDYNPQDWSLSLSELLRSIQLYNTLGYHACPEGEDGYCAGLAAAP